MSCGGGPGSWADLSAASSPAFAWRRPFVSATAVYSWPPWASLGSLTGKFQRQTVWLLAPVPTCVQTNFFWLCGLVYRCSVLQYFKANVSRAWVPYTRDGGPANSFTSLPLTRNLLPMSRCARLRGKGVEFNTSAVTSGGLGCFYLIV